MPRTPYTDHWPEIRLYLILIIVRPVPGCPPVPVSFRGWRRKGSAHACPLRRPGPVHAPGRPRSHSDFGSYQERSGTLNGREVDRGWDASAADARQGPPGVVRTPPAAAVRPLPGIRRSGPGRGLAPDGRRRPRFGRMSTIATIRAWAGPRPARATHDVEGPLLARGANPSPS